jgi:hypothetical protein
VRRAWENIAAREHILYEKHNIHRRAIYARRALRNKGVVRALADWAAVPLKDSREGFDDFIDRGMWDMTGEAIIVIDFPHRFTPKTIADARAARISRHKTTNNGEEK